MNHETSSTIFLPILKTVAAVVCVTFLLLFLLAFLLFKFHFNDTLVNTCIIFIYALANFTGGMIIGKVKQEKKFLWGFVAGLTYFIILSILSFIIMKGFYSNPFDALIAFTACAGGGILGGMLA